MLAIERLQKRVRIYHHSPGFMARNPILPLYYNDLTTSTQDWTDEEFGAYVRLLIHQWRQGGLPKDYQRLTRIATSLPTNWEMLKAKFPEVDGLLKNPVMEEIREKRAKHSEKQRTNVQNRYQTSTKQSTKLLPLEKEIENENEIEEWKRWGEQILKDNDQYWHGMHGRTITQEELDHFLSVATRNEWTMNNQQAFRYTLHGFKMNGQSTKQPRKKSFDIKSA